MRSRCTSLPEQRNRLALRSSSKPSNRKSSATNLEHLPHYAKAPYQRCTGRDRKNSGNLLALSMVGWAQSGEGCNTKFRQPGTKKFRSTAANGGDNHEC